MTRDNEQHRILVLEEQIAKLIDVIATKDSQENLRPDLKGRKSLLKHILGSYNHDFRREYARQCSLRSSYKDYRSSNELKSSKYNSLEQMLRLVHTDDTINNDTSFRLDAAELRWMLFKTKYQIYNFCYELLRFFFRAIRSLKRSLKD